MKKHLYILSIALLILLANFANAEHKRFFAYRSFWPEYKAMREFGKVGVDLYAVMPSNAYNSLGEPYCKYPPTWPWKGVYDWEALDVQFEDVIKQNPKARFIFIIDLNSPMWLAKHVDRRYGIGGDSYNEISNSVCTKAWVEPTEAYLKAVIEHAEKKYGDRIEKYMISAGGTSEWYDCSNGVANVEKVKRWHKWREEKKLPPSDVPEVTDIHQYDFNGKIRDPQKRKIVMEYLQFTSDVVVDQMRRFCKITKEMTGRKKEVGVFSGYLLTSLEARFDLEKTYGSEDIDFFGTPPAYNRTRAIGAGTSPQALLNSAVAKGKGWFQEIDHRTHTYNHKLTKHVTIGEYFNAKNQAESNAILKREFSFATIAHTSMWCFDMWGGVFSSDETMKVVGQSYEIWKKYCEDKSDVKAEIAIVGDSKCVPYTKYAYLTGVYFAMSDAGLHYDGYNFPDLEKIDLKKYKVIIFPHTLEMTPEREKFLREKVFVDGRTVIFLDAFGISDGNTLDVNRVEKYTGIPYDFKAKVLKKDMGNWKSVLISNPSNINGKIVRQTAKDAGVHFYIEDCDPVYANEKLLCVHTKNGGKKTVTLKKKYSKIIDLYAKKVVAENTDKFEYDFKAPDTVLFELEQ